MNIVILFLMLAYNRLCLLLCIQLDVKLEVTLIRLSLLFTHIALLALVSQHYSLHTMCTCAVPTLIELIIAVFTGKWVKVDGH